MKSKIYYEDDADLNMILDQTIGIIGYGAQGAAHAQNLRDSGCKVVIGQRAGMAQRADFFVLTWVLVGQAAPSLLLALFLYARKESGTSGGSFFAVLPGTHGMRPDLHAACAPG